MTKSNAPAAWQDVAGFQDGLAHAVMTGDMRLDGFLVDPAHAGRLRIYRNNRLSAIADGLVSDYPAIERLVGTDFLRAAARAYADAHPPAVRSLTLYGADFPDFLQALPGAQAHPYLGDVARLDRAYIEALFAADIPALSPDALAEADEKQLLDLHLSLHPSATLVVSPWPVRAIWSANRIEDARGKRLRVRESWSATLLWRLGEQVVHRALEPDEFVFITTLGSGKKVGYALQRAAQGDRTVPLLGFFSEMLMHGMFCAKPSTGRKNPL